MPLDAFEADLLRCETVTRPLMQSKGRTLRWFRHPFLHLGTTHQVRTAFQEFLAAHGYVVAPVTVNHSEWEFAVTYARAQAQGDEDAARRGASAQPTCPTWKRCSRGPSAGGRPIPHVLVLHANSLNAEYFGALAAMRGQRSYRFISLDDALRDGAYASPVGLSGIEGESWLERWTREAGLRPPQSPPVPGFVTQRAGLAAYRGD